MKTTELQQQQGIWQLMKEAAKSMWKWFTAAPETTSLNYSADEEKVNEKILINQTDIEGTPFRVTGHPTKGYWITMGPYRLTLQKPTKKEAIDDLEKEKWNIIARLVQVAHDFEKNVKPNIEEKKKIKKIYQKTSKYIPSKN